MKNPHQEIVRTLYEDNHLTPDEIAEQENLEVLAVKGILMQCSSRFRREIKTQDVEAVVSSSNGSVVKSQVGIPADIETRLLEKHQVRAELDLVSQDEALEIAAMLKNVALFSENDGVRSKTGIYLLNEFKGRHDAGMGAQSKKEQKTVVNNFIARQHTNVLMLNKALRENRRLKDVTSEEEQPSCVLEAVNT